MIKFVAAAVWICAATLGAVFFSFQTASGAKPEAEPDKPLLGGLDYLKTSVLSVPLLSKTGIKGYFLTRLVYTAEPAKLAKLSVPAESLIIDEVYSYLYGNPLIDLTSKDSMDLDAFRAGIRDAINKRVGDTVIQEVLVEQVDFLTKDEIRDNSMRRRSKPAPEAPKPAAPAH